MTTDPRIEAAAQALLDVTIRDMPKLASEEYVGVTWHAFEADAVAMLAAADAVDPLRQPGHRVDISGDDWTLQHPAECRPDMLGCPLNIAVRVNDVTAMEDGTYTVTKTEAGDLLLTPEVDQ